MERGEFGHGGWGAEALLPGFVFLVLVLAAMAVFGVLLLRSRGHLLSLGNQFLTPPPAPKSSADPALLLLRERYARGEIDTVEYEERRHRLLDEMATL